MARDQVKEGSHAPDVCTAFVGRDEVAEMNEVTTRFTGSASAPLVIDSPNTPLEQALARHGGKPIINSINFEDGEEPASKRLKLAKKFGAAVIALTIDEEGMAKMRKRSWRSPSGSTISRSPARPRPRRLLFDPLTFTIATGSEDDRKLGQWTLEGIESISREMPDCQIILGLSNISFGLNPAARCTC